jgi:hypothetical protein
VKAPWIIIVAAGWMAGCSSLPTTGNGIVAIEVRTPTSLTLRLGDSLTLQARALNQSGDSVAADIRWFTVDTAAVTVDSIRGVVTARQPTGTARIQASFGTLHSDPLTLLLAPAQTTLVLPRQR